MKTSQLAVLLFACMLAPPCTGNAQAVNPAVALMTATINDPLFGDIKAFTVNFPSGWQFQGTVIAGLGSGLPSPVFRAYSPDGLSEIRLLPAFNWEVMHEGKSGWEGLGVPPEQISLSESFTAAQFLDRYVRTLATAHTLDVTSVGTAYQEQFDDLLRQMNANGRQNPKFAFHTTGDTAALRIETSNGTFIIEQRLRARVICTLWSKPVAGHAGNCTARLDVLRAPKGRLDALANLVDSRNLTNAKHENAWLSALLARMNADRWGRISIRLTRTASPWQYCIARLRISASFGKTATKEWCECGRPFNKPA